MAVKVDFCATTTNLVCATETIVGLVPLIAFIYFGYFSIQETRGRTAYHREKYTFRHLSKMILSGLISLTTLIFLVVYIMKEDEISLKTAIITSASFILWVYNSFLIRKEYNCLGYTTNHLRIAWITMLVCQTILLIFALSGKNTDDFSKVELIYILNEVFIASIIIIGFTYSDDYPPETPKHDNYKSLMDDSIHVIEDGYFENSAASLDRSVDKSVDKSLMSEVGDRDSLFRPFEETVEGNPNRVNRREGAYRENNDVSYGSREHLGGSANVSLKQDIGLIQNVSVTGYEEIIRDTKLTTVYVIEYYIKGLQFVTKRSYSEFEALRKNIDKVIKNEKLSIELPEIPAKKALGKTNDTEGLDDRKNAFDNLLKAIVDSKAGFGHLADFLQSPHVLELYQKISKRNKIKEAAVGLLQTVSGERKTEASKEVKTKVMDAGQGPNMILDYTHAEGDRGRSFSTAAKHYAVETVGVFDGVDKSTNYKFKIFEKSTGFESNISKRYTDFKNLHSSLKKEVANNDKKLLPELPYKSSNQTLTARDDQRVIEYRKVALKTYLANILNNPRLQNYKSIKDFINPQGLV